MDVYAVNEKLFGAAEYRAAVAYADSIGADVVEIATGVRRWTPAPKASKKKANLYAHRLAAYRAQCKANGITPKK